MGTGVTGALTGPMPSKKVYSALSVLMMVQDAPSLIISLLDSLGHGVACDGRIIHFLILTVPILPSLPT